MKPNQMEQAWLEISLHIKEQFMKKHGSAQIWYEFVDQCAEEGLKGLDVYKCAVNWLASDDKFVRT